MDNQLKVITYNIDGLPEKLDLNDLPLILKPIAWIYKLIKKTTLITINDGNNKSNNIKKIGEYLEKENADLIAVQEDFNYHDELTKKLYDKYCWGTYTGGFDLKNIFKSMTWFPPRFKADGLNLYYNVNNITLKNEHIVPWNKSYGYIDHANDLLTHKGFRQYTMTIDDPFIDIDVYVVHMDADFYHSEKCPDVFKDIEARKSQLKQLVSRILCNYHYGSLNPVIIIGDTNSYDKYEWDKQNIETELIHPINHDNLLTIKEAIPNNYSDCDKIFYINNYNADYELELIDCKFDLDLEHLSDHKPLIATFNIKKKYDI